MLANDDIGNLGRLGNQMFQYTSLRGLAAKHGYEYCLPPREVVATRDPNCINSDITMFECFTISDAPKHVTNFPKVMESTFGLCPNFWENCPDNISLYGYFQTEKYFKHIEKQIRKEFTFRDEIGEPTKDAFKSNFGDSDVLSIHLRRGDYLKYPHHPVQELEYYEKALKEFPEDMPVMVFSDGIEWCKEQKFSKAIDLFLLRETILVLTCVYNLFALIILSQTLHSLGGVLGWQRVRRLLPPYVWFAGPNASRDLSDLYLPGWTII